MSSDEQTSENSEDPKIVVDDDWKSQVEADKQRIQEEMESESSDDYDMPEASFLMLITSFATQAMVALGQVPDPVSQQVDVNKPFAKYMISRLSWHILQLSASAL